MSNSRGKYSWDRCHQRDRAWNKNTCATPLEGGHTLSSSLTLFCNKQLRLGYHTKRCPRQVFATWGQQFGITGRSEGSSSSEGHNRFRKALTANFTLSAMGGHSQKTDERFVAERSSRVEYMRAPEELSVSLPTYRNGTICPQ